MVGSSPEALVTVKDGQATMHPIAGTRPRGGDPETDARLADDLLADDKGAGRTSHARRPGRNDLGGCAPGSVEVVEFMAVERYSHVMHLVSTVVGRLSDGRTAFDDAFGGDLPAGTLSGAPKPRAMEIIDDLEPVRRGL